MKGNILVVDDEPVLRDLVQEVLDQEGFLVETADCARAALERIRDQRFHLVVLDLALPDMNGILLCQKIQENQPQLKGKVVFITGIGLESNTSLHLKSLAGAYLEKPFEMESLTRTVRSLLGQSPSDSVPTPETL